MVGDVPRDLGAIATVAQCALIKQGQFARGSKPDAGPRLGVFHVASQDAIAALGILGCAAGRPFPITAVRIRALREIQIPERPGNELCRMVIGPDDAAASRYPPLPNPVAFCEPVGKPPRIS